MTSTRVLRTQDFAGINVSEIEKVHNIIFLLVYVYNVRYENNYFTFSTELAAT